MASVTAGFYFLDGVDDFLALDNLAKYTVAVTLSGGIGVIQEMIVGNVDKKLRGGGMRIAGTCHGNRVGLVFGTLSGFVLDRCKGGLFFQAGGVAAPLDHEAVYDAVKQGVVIMTAIDIAQKVLGCGRCFFAVE